MKEFIKINNERIRKNTIKRYTGYGETKLKIYYNSTRYKIDSEVFEFSSKEERDNMLELLDSIFIL